MVIIFQITVATPSHYHLFYDYTDEMCPYVIYINLIFVILQTDNKVESVKRFNIKIMPKFENRTFFVNLFPRIPFPTLPIVNINI